MSRIRRPAIKTGYALSAVLLSLSFMLVFYSLQNLRKGTEKVSQFSQLNSRLGFYEAQLSKAGNTVQTYISTKDMQWLRQFHDAENTLKPMQTELENLTEQDPVLLRSWRQVVQRSDRYLQLLKDYMASFQRRGNRFTEEEKKLNASVMEAAVSSSAAIREMTGIAQQRMQERKKALIGFFSSTDLIIFIALCTGLLGIVYSIMTYFNESKARSQADEQNIAHKSILEQKVQELEVAHVELEAMRENEKWVITGRLARTMAHEVRNPLANISLAALQLEDPLLPGDQQELRLMIIHRNATRINTLVGQLLNATIDLSLEMKEGSINQLLDESLEFIKDRLSLQDIIVQKNYDKDDCIVLIDHEKIKIALLNIMINAIEAIHHEQGIIQLVSKQHNGHCIIEITDNGSGIAAENIPLIFEPLFTNKPKGVGFGLANTRNIITTHGGRVEVESNGENGSTFRVILPKNSGETCHTS